MSTIERLNIRSARKPEAKHGITEVQVVPKTQRTKESHCTETVNPTLTGLLTASLALGRPLATHKQHNDKYVCILITKTMLQYFSVEIDHECHQYLLQSSFRFRQAKCNPWHYCLVSQNMMNQICLCCSDMSVLPQYGKPVSTTPQAKSSVLLSWAMWSSLMLLHGTVHVQFKD